MAEQRGFEGRRRRPSPGCARTICPARSREGGHRREPPGRLGRTARARPAREPRYVDRARLENCTSAG